MILRSSTGNEIALILALSDNNVRGNFSNRFSFLILARFAGETFYETCQVFLKIFQAA
jgi:hypothetical protein